MTRCWLPDWRQARQTESSGGMGVKGRFLRGLCFLILCGAFAAAASCEELPGQVQTLTISAVGDCTLGRNYKMAYENSWDDCFSRFGAAYFLQNVSDVFHADDITIANLEGVLSESAPRQKTFYRQKKERVDEKTY